ncbi:MAG: hypothetical protein DRI48_10215 [Chloroflexi bacterium]|mgnify:CR=1 FL=1|nr:MAG: hypothetical protein DRI48_10215 [Chloroflexota bacterium]
MKKILIFSLLVLILAQVSIAVMDGSETMVRSMPSSVGAGQQFTVTYKAIGTSGDYGVSVVDTVTGGCTPSNLKFVLTSPATTYQVTMTAPSSGSCTFSGDYKYGTFDVKLLTDSTISVSSVCVPSTEICDGIDNDCDGQIDEGNVCTCTEDWDCTAWSECINSKQTRVCTDLNNCGTSATKPDESKDCSVGGKMDVCQYFEWAKGIDDKNYCAWGIGIVGFGFILLLRFVK